MKETVHAPLKCSIQLDTLRKECLETEEGLYLYNLRLGLRPGHSKCLQMHVGKIKDMLPPC